MTRSFLTVRVGATVTHVQCRDMAAMWITHLASAVVDPMSAGQAKSPTAMLTSPSPTPPSRRGGAQEDGPQQHGDEDEVRPKPPIPESPCQQMTWEIFSSAISPGSALSSLPGLPRSPLGMKSVGKQLTGAVASKMDAEVISRCVFSVRPTLRGLQGSSLKV